MADYKVSDSDLASVASAIRTKGGTSAALSFPDGFVTAIGNISGGSTPTLITKSIAANGTYDASDDSADGYSSVTVAVPGPPIVTGTFQGQSTDKGTAITISIPYTGSGYPIAGMIYPTAGAWVANSALATLVQKFAIIMVCFEKIDNSTTPDYSNNTEANQMEILAEFKYSDSDATDTSTGKGHAKRNYWNTNASASYAECIKFKSATSLSVFIASTSYGFKDGVEYTYQIIYSS